jgi:integrase
MTVAARKPMTKAKPAAWAKALNAAVRQAAGGAGWHVRADRNGMTRLEIKVPHADQKVQSVQLPYAWSSSSQGPIINRVSQLVSTLQGDSSLSLRQAMPLVEGRSNQARLDWPKALASFNRAKTTRGTAISETTWNRKYLPVLQRGLQLMECANPPRDATGLIEAATGHWQSGCRAREIGVRAMAAFLDHAVQRCDFPSAWLPSGSLRELIGAAPRDGRRVQKSDPIPDADIVAMIESLPDELWSDALRLIAELGLRPIELEYLSVREDPRSGKRRWHVAYEKKAGRGSTKPRWVESIPLKDHEGNLQQWELQERWEDNVLKLPTFTATNGVADAIRLYLRNKPSWKTMVAAAELRSEHVTLYGLRHAYSLRCHRLGIDAAGAADLMGHSLQIHIDSYPWSCEDHTARQVARARERLVEKD